MADASLVYRELPALEVDQGLERAEQEMEWAAKEHHGVLADDAACWAEAAAPVMGTSSLSGNALCGPILFATSDPTEFWVVVDLAFETILDNSGNEASAPATAALVHEVPHTVQASRNQLYVRPDAREMPSESGLDVPPPPPAEADAIFHLEESSAKLSPPSDDLLRGQHFEMALTGVGVLESVQWKDDLWSAPKGHELVAVNLISEFDHGIESVTIEVGDREPLGVYEKTDGLGTFFDEHSLVIVAPEDADVILSVYERKGPNIDATADHVSQRYDLRAGERIDPISVWYRNTVGDVIKTVEVPCTWSSVGKKFGHDKEPCTVRIEAEVSLAFLFDDGRSHTSTDADFILPDSRGDALLVLSSKQARVELVLPTGERLDPINYLDPRQDTHNDWVFPVPADFTEGTLIVNAHNSERDKDNWPYKEGIDHELPIAVPRN